MGTARKPRAVKRIYQLRIEMLDIEPVIWRRLWVPETLKLSRLDRVIQEAFGWTNSHLHEFCIGAHRYGLADEEGWDLDDGPRDDTRFTLKKVLGEVVTEFVYTYDFGDGWRHRVEVEGIMAATPYNDWPVCLAGENACPPEDVGGTGGYVDFLETMADPDHEEHFDIWRWNGGPFDPKAFDVNAANRRIHKLR